MNHEHNAPNQGGYQGRKPRLRRDRGDICQLRVEVWATVKYLAGVVADEHASTHERLKAAQAMGIIASVYAKLIDQYEYEERIRRIDAKADAATKLRANAA